MIMSDFGVSLWDQRVQVFRRKADMSITMSTNKDLRAVFMPYCLKRQADGRYAVLNREFKPVGFFTSDHVEYKDCPVLVTVKELTSKEAKEISHRGDADTSTIYLYEDSSDPIHDKAQMVAYLKRLEVLAKLTVKQ